MANHAGGETIAARRSPGLPRDQGEVDQPTVMAPEDARLNDFDLGLSIRNSAGTEGGVWCRGGLTDSQ
jgi:hypothetical protein